jgi:O-antigen/teichoic acid export membrane protein
VAENKYKKLAVNTVLFGVGTIGSKVLTFVLVRFYTEIFNPTEMSRANIILQTCILLSLVATLSLEEAVLRFGITEKSEKKKSEIFCTSFVIIFLWDIIFAVILLFVLGLVDDTKNYVPVMLFYVFSSAFHKINQQAVRSDEKVKLFAYNGIQNTFLYVIFTLLFMKVFNWGINGFILATGVADLISGIFLLFYGKNYKKFKELHNPLKQNVWKDMLRYALPLIPTSVLWWVVSAGDLYMVKYMVGETENGIYSTAYKIPTLIAVMSTVFYQAWQMSATIEVHSESVKKFYTQVYKAFSSFLFVASGGLLLLLKPLTDILTASEYHNAYMYSIFLVLSTLFGCFCQFSGAIYNAAKQTKHTLWTSILAATVNVIFNLILIPHFGAFGAGFATMLSYAACAFWRQHDTRKIINYSVNNTKLLVNIALLGVMATSYFTSITPLLLIPSFALILALNFSDLLLSVRKIILSRKSPRT